MLRNLRRASEHITRNYFAKITLNIVYLAAQK